MSPDPTVRPPESFPGVRLLFSLDFFYSHLNHGSYGAVPLPAQRAADRLRTEQESDPMRFFTEGLVERIAHTRRHLARFVGADPDGTALVANVTTGVAIALNSIRLRAGDQVLLTDHTYGAVAFEVARRCAETGALPLRVPVALDATDDEIVRVVCDAVTPRTRIAVVDQVTSPTARLFPARRLVSELQRRGVVVVVDAAHVPGVLDTRVAAQADFWCGNLHKWCFAPRGTGLLAVAPAHRARVRPPAVSWQRDAGFPANVEYQGTVDHSGWLAAPAGVFVLDSLGLRAAREHNAQLACYGHGLLTDALGTEPVAATGNLPMQVVRLPAGVAVTEAAAVSLRRKIAQHLRAHVAVGSWNGVGLLRICAQVYNRAEEYERLAEKLPALLRAG